MMIKKVIKDVGSTFIGISVGTVIRLVLKNNTKGSGGFAERILVAIGSAAIGAYAIKKCQDQFKDEVDETFEKAEIIEENQ
jgi:hypothetical protein